MTCGRFGALRHCFFGAAFCIVFPSSSSAESTSNLRIAISAVSPSVSWYGPFEFLNLGGGAALTGKRGIEMLRTLGPRFYLDAAVGQAIAVEQANPGAWTRAT